MIYAHFESILVSEKKWEAKSKWVSYKQKHVACSHVYKLIFVDDKVSTPFTSCSGEDAVCNFINNMVKERKYSSEVMKKHLNKEMNNIMKIVKSLDDSGILLKVSTKTMENEIDKQKVLF